MSTKDKSRKSVECFELPRKSMDLRDKLLKSPELLELPRKSIDSRDKPRMSVDTSSKLKTFDFNFRKHDVSEKTRMSCSQIDRPQISMDHFENSRKSIDHQLERGRKDIDWHNNKPTGYKLHIAYDH